MSSEQKRAFAVGKGVNYAECVSGAGELVRVRAGRPLVSDDRAVIEACLAHPAIVEVDIPKPRAARKPKAEPVAAEDAV